MKNIQDQESLQALLYYLYLYYILMRFTYQDPLCDDDEYICLRSPGGGGGQGYRYVSVFA